MSIPKSYSPPNPAHSGSILMVGHPWEYLQGWLGIAIPWDKPVEVLGCSMQGITSLKIFSQTWKCIQCTVLWHRKCSWVWFKRSQVSAKADGVGRSVDEASRVVQKVEIYCSTSENEESPGKRPRLEDDVTEENRGGSKQRNRRRCYRCQTKLELVQQELGSCRCGYVFCMLHRLPEQHDCLFDHLGRGREEAILKMVKLDRKVGRSCQRIGEECS
ncbi:ZFAN3 protein, partial [Polypterus senegalus]